MSSLAVGRSFISTRTFAEFLSERRPLLYVISQRQLLKRKWADWVRQMVDCGVDCLQVREAGLTDRQLLDLVRETVAICGERTAVLVSRRADLALAGGACGVHLPSHGLPGREVRASFGQQIWIGVSVHSRAELEDAAADYALLGPIQDPLSKRAERPALGFGALALPPLPVIALGGITEDNARAALQAGASGVAGITLGLEVTREMVRKIKEPV